jgi:hypothetical protein
VDIGQPKRIIEIEPATLPVPGEVEPERQPQREPARQPEREPVPSAPEQRLP